MPVRFLVSLLFVLALYSGSVSAEQGSFSITDFTMHKVVPKQDTKPAPASFNPSLKKEQAKKTVKTTETVQKPVVKIEKKPGKEPVKKPVMQSKNDVKVTIKEIKTDTTPIEKIAKQTEEAEKTTQPREEITETLLREIDRNKYVENLNKHLDGDTLKEEEEISSGKMGLKKYNHYEYIIKPTLSLVIVMALILILAWLYNKLKGLNPNALLSGKFKDMDINRFNVLASSSLGQGKIIHLVEINGKQLVIGSTNNSINILTEINPEDMENLKAKAEKKTKSEKKPQPQEPDEFEGTEPKSYSARYSDIYKDYLE